MTTTSFTNQITLTDAAWFNDVNTVTYNTYYVKGLDYGAVGNGTTDDTAAIQAAIDACGGAGGGTVFFHPGTYKYTSLSITSNYVNLIGSGKYASVLSCSSTNGGVTVNGTNLGSVKNLGFAQSVDSTTATAVLLKLTSVFRFLVRDCYFNGYSGASNYAHNLLYASGNSVFIDHCEGVGGKTTGVKISGGTGGYFMSQCLFNQIAVTGAPLYVENVTGGDVQITDCDFLQGQNCTITNTNFSTLTNCFFDSAQSGVVLSGIEMVNFTACQFANRVNGGSGDGVGVNLGNSSYCTFQGCSITNCGSDGVQLAADCVGITFNACNIIDNNTTAAAGHNGITIAANAGKFKIINCTITNNSALLSGGQFYGIAIPSGTSDNFVITGNDLRGNTTGGLIDLSSGVAKIVIDNLFDGTPTIPAVMGRLPNIDIGPVAYGSLGTNAVHVAGTIYVSEIFIPTARWINGIGILNGATVGTDKGIVALYGPDGGAAIANSTTAGAFIVGADSFQEYSFTAAKILLNPGRYFIAFQSNGTTDKTRRIAANTYLNWTKSFAGAFGTLGSLTVPTTFTADVGPIGYLF